MGGGGGADGSGGAERGGGSWRGFTPAAAACGGPEKAAFSPGVHCTAMRLPPSLSPPRGRSPTRPARPLSVRGEGRPPGPLCIPGARDAGRRWAADIGGRRGARLGSPPEGWWRGGRVAAVAPTQCGGSSRREPLLLPLQEPELLSPCWGQGLSSLRSGVSLPRWVVNEKGQTLIHAGLSVRLM